MADLVLFHHALGLTPGVHAFADELRAAGHRVTVPDLYDGATFATIDEGLAYAESVGFDTIVERGVVAAADLPAAAAYAGMSLGVLPAQKLAQTRPGALALLSYHSAVPVAAFGETWPDGVAFDIHVHADDEMGDVDVANDIAATVPGARLFTYPGDSHLFTDSGLADHDPAATALVLERTLELLARWG